MNFESLDKEIIRKISINRKRIEDKLQVKLEIKGNQIEISGEEVDIYTTSKVLEALERNFPLETAFLLIAPDYIIEDISIKDITKKRNLSLVRARIIGTQGKTIKLISELSDCFLTLHNNTVSIIGSAEKIKFAINAIKSLISGSKQANVYSYLERARKKLRKGNLSLR